MLHKRGKERMGGERNGILVSRRGRGGEVKGRNGQKVLWKERVGGEGNGGMVIRGMVGVLSF